MTLRHALLISIGLYGTTHAEVILCPEQIPEMCVINSDKLVEKKILADLSKLKWRPTRGLSGTRLPGLSLLILNKKAITASYLVDNRISYSFSSQKIAGHLPALDLSHPGWTHISLLPKSDPRIAESMVIADDIFIKNPTGLNLIGRSDCGLDVDRFVIIKPDTLSLKFRALQFVGLRWDNYYKLFPSSMVGSRYRFYFNKNENAGDSAQAKPAFRLVRDIDSLYFLSFNIVSPGAFGDDGKYFSDGSKDYLCSSITRSRVYRGVVYLDSTALLLLGDWEDVSKPKLIFEFKYIRFYPPLYSRVIDSPLFLPQFGSD